ncbi:meiotic recombination protein REC8-like protein [Platysternon megacephalum]|uniref:Meiotic recombination protein REC8-like protein n=1 Tax=Platysternon megacephalum TaxID=55544 RepID=A0A4D9DRB1_9SAUR|nr:meiotic recombination protein REC8-like protein [Platysternon megacephalum]
MQSPQSIHTAHTIRLVLGTPDGPLPPPAAVPETTETPNTLPILHHLGQFYCRHLDASNQTNAAFGEIHRNLHRQCHVGMGVAWERLKPFQGSAKPMGVLTPLPQSPGNLNP